MKNNYFGRNNFGLKDIPKMLNDLIVYFKAKKKNRSEKKNSQMEIDDILEKLSKEGYDKLTKEEKDKLAE